MGNTNTQSATVFFLFFYHGVALVRRSVVLQKDTSGDLVMALLDDGGSELAQKIGTVITVDHR